MRWVCVRLTKLSTKPPKQPIIISIVADKDSAPDSP